MADLNANVLIVNIWQIEAWNTIQQYREELWTYSIAVMNLKKKKNYAVWKTLQDPKNMESMIPFVWGLKSNQTNVWPYTLEKQLPEMRYDCWVMETFNTLEGVWVSQIYSFVKTNQTVHLTWVHFYGCKLYFNFNMSFKKNFKIFFTLIWIIQCISWEAHAPFGYHWSRQ